MSVPRPQYPTYPGAKRMPIPSQPMRPLVPPQQYQPVPPAAMTHHEEVVRYVYDSWNRATNDPNTDPNYPVTYYQEKEHNPLLKDFKPFDLESWCERRRAEQTGQRPSS